MLKIISTKTYKPQGNCGLTSLVSLIESSAGSDLNPIFNNANWAAAKPYTPNPRSFRFRILSGYFCNEWRWQPVKPQFQTPSPFPPVTSKLWADKALTSKALIPEFLQRLIQVINTTFHKHRPKTKPWEPELSAPQPLLIPLPLNGDVSREEAPSGGSGLWV